MDTRPFIKLFTQHRNKYFFDVNKNAILNVDDKTYDQLKNLISGDLLMVDCMEGSNLDFYTIKKLKNEGFLSSKRIKEIINPFDNIVSFYIANKVNMLSLQVTQQCNFRCEYCVYSGNYRNRDHSNNKMELSTALKGIDFLLKHSKDAKSISLGFYGGEPLLAFDLIKDCILYAEKEAEGKNISYHITTNGSIVNEEIIDLFSKYNVHLTLSLDGPKEIHDKYRRLASNNKGTFDIIARNLAFIEKNYYDYFKENISLNTVIEGCSDYQCIDYFFCNNEQLKGMTVSSSFVSDDYTDDSPSGISEETQIYHEYEFFIVLWNNFKKRNNNISKLVGQAYKHLSKEVEMFKPSDSLPDKFHHGGPCIPGAQRLFLNVNGDFYPCERVSETSELMKIGNINQGFDLDKIRNILNIGKITEENCKNCWAIRLCQICAAQADNNREFSKELKLKHCASQKFAAEEMLKNYTALKELGYDFTDTLKLTELDIGELC